MRWSRRKFAFVFDADYCYCYDEGSPHAFPCAICRFFLPLLSPRFCHLYLLKNHFMVYQSSSIASRPNHMIRFETQNDENIL